MQKGHSVRIRPQRWEEIEKKAWKLAQEADKFIKPTDVVDALLALKIHEIELEDLEKVKSI